MAKFCRILDTTIIVPPNLRLQGAAAAFRCLAGTLDLGRACRQSVAAEVIRSIVQPGTEPGIPESRLRGRRSPRVSDPVFDIAGWKRFGFHETELHQPGHDLMVEHRRADPGFAEQLPQKFALQLGQFHARTPLIQN